MYYRMPFIHPGLWWLVGLVCLIVLVVAIVGLFLAVRSNRHTTPPLTWQPPYAMPPAPSRPTPHDILRERLARGEISVDEYQRTMNVLGPDPYAPPTAYAPPVAPVPPQASVQPPQDLDASQQATQYTPPEPPQPQQ